MSEVAVLSMKRLQELVVTIPEKRRTLYGNYRHSLTNVLLITLLAVVSGFYTWDDIADYAEGKKEFLNKTLGIEKVPSVSTFKRVISMIEPSKFEEIYRKWVLPTVNKDKTNQYCVDGKSSRGANQYEECNLHTVSVYVKGNGISIAQQVVGEKSNEITAIPMLLEDIDISGGIVSIDAMGCQEEIAKTIRKNEADYILSLKKNHKNAYEAVEEYFTWAQNDIAERRVITSASEQEISHGRVVTRKVIMTKCVEDFEFAAKWKDIKSIGMVERRCKCKGKETIGKRYFISSLDCDAVTFMARVREHWGIENKLHWVLDVVFREDASAIHKAHAVENMAILRKMAMAFMQKQKKQGVSYRKLRTKALFNDDYILNMIEYGSK